LPLRDQVADTREVWGRQIRSPHAAVVPHPGIVPAAVREVVVDVREGREDPELELPPRERAVGRLLADLEVRETGELQRLGQARGRASLEPRAPRALDARPDRVLVLVPRRI